MPVFIMESVSVIMTTLLHYLTVCVAIVVDISSLGRIFVNGRTWYNIK